MTKTERLLDNLLGLCIATAIFLALLSALGCDQGINLGFVSPGKDAQAEYDQRVNHCFSAFLPESRVADIEERIKAAEFCADYVSKSIRFADCNVQ